MAVDTPICIKNELESRRLKAHTADTLIPMVDERRILGLKVDIRLKGENSVAMGNAHRLV